MEACKHTTIITLLLTIMSSELTHRYGVPSSTKALNLGDKSILQRILLSIDACDPRCKFEGNEIGVYGRYHGPSCRSKHVRVLSGLVTVSRNWYSVIVPEIWKGPIKLQSIVSAFRRDDLFEAGSMSTSSNLVGFSL